MIKLILLVLVIFSLPLTVCGQIDNVLDKSTVLVPRAEFENLVALASSTDSSCCSIEQVNMRITDNGYLKKAALLEIDYAIKVVNKDTGLVPVLFVKDGSLTLLSASGEKGPVNIQELAGTYTVILNKEGLHRVKLMFHINADSDSMGYLTALTIGFPDTGQAWCRIDMNSPSIRLLESFGDLDRNIAQSESGFTSNSFVKNRSSIRLVWSRGQTSHTGDGGVAIAIREAGRIVSHYLYPLKVQSSSKSKVSTDSTMGFPVLLKMDERLDLVEAKGCVPSTSKERMSETGVLTYKRCGDYLLISPDKECEYIALKVVAGGKIWDRAGRGRFTVSLPLVSAIDVKTVASIVSEGGVELLSVTSPSQKQQPVDTVVLSGSDKKLKNLVLMFSGISSNTSLLTERVFPGNETVVFLRVRTPLSGMEDQHTFAVSGFEANLYPSSSEKSIMVHERFGIINKGSTLFPLHYLPSEVTIVAAYSAGERVAPFLLPENSVSPSGLSSSVGIPLTFFGSIAKPSRGLIDVYYSVDLSGSSNVALYGFEYVKTKSKVVLHLMKDWTGTVAVTDNHYELGEFSEETLPSEAPGGDSSPYPLNFNVADVKSRTFRLAPVESMPVGLKATFHQMANITPGNDTLSMEGASIAPSNLPEGSSSYTGSAINSSPVLNVSLLGPSVGSFRLEIVFFSFFGILCSFVIRNETLGSRVFGLSALVLLGSLFYGPFDENVMMALVAALIVAGLAWISCFILKKCSLERDCND